MDVALSDRPSFGFSRSLAAFFQLAADQALAIDSKGNITGVLELSDVGTTDPVGMLTIVKGKVEQEVHQAKLERHDRRRGRSAARGEARGRAAAGRLPRADGSHERGERQGKGVKSSALDLVVT